MLAAGTRRNKTFHLDRYIDRDTINRPVKTGPMSIGDKQVCYLQHAPSNTACRLKGLTGIQSLPEELHNLRSLLEVDGWGGLWLFADIHLPGSS